MFTGLIEEMGYVKEIRRGGDSAFLVIKAKEVLKEIKVGDSISVNGVCLTVKAVNSDSFSVDVISQTLKRTNLGMLLTGEAVNLERAMRLGERLGGHLVSGHIDETGVIEKKRWAGNSFILTIGISQKIAGYMIPHGSVAVDGVSLTIIDCNPRNFTVAIIPYTAQTTTLGIKKIGQALNLEADLIAKHIEKLSGKETRDGGITTEFLTKLGYETSSQEI